GAWGGAGCRERRRRRGALGDVGGSRCGRALLVAHRQCHRGGAEGKFHGCADAGRRAARPRPGEREGLTFAWSWPSGTATGVRATVKFPLGTTTVTLTVSD